MNITRPPAKFSPCARYRYTLPRRWDGGDGVLSWVLCNPSTACDTADDPTIRRVIRFSCSWGYGGCDVYNIFALRSTDPTVLYLDTDPIGPENDDALASIDPQAPVVFAWGTHGAHLGRGAKVSGMFKGRGWCLGTNADGSPKHPLYLSAQTKLVEYGGQ